MLITFFLSSCHGEWRITLLITYTDKHPLWHGVYPHMGPPPPRIPPYYTVRMSYRGYNPLNEIKIFLGKICPLPKGKEDIFINMEYTISENRLRNLFVNFMDSQYDLSYDKSTREFVGKDGEIFGYLLFNSMEYKSKNFYYGDYKTEYSLNEMFGELTNELLLYYLRERFPDVNIDGIE